MRVVTFKTRLSIDIPILSGTFLDFFLEERGRMYTCKGETERGLIGGQASYPLALS